MTTNATETGVFNYTENYAPDSTAIENAWYNEDTEELVIQFPSGDSFIYFNINEGVWTDFVNHYSAGRFYSQDIKGRYDGAFLGDVEFNRVESKSSRAATEEALTKYPEATRFVVVWHNGDEYEREFEADATDDTDALRQFWNRIKEIEEFSGTTFVVKLKAVIHYF